MTLPQVVLVEDRKWGAEERDLLYKVTCCKSLTPSYLAISLCSNHVHLLVLRNLSCPCQGKHTHTYLTVSGNEVDALLLGRAFRGMALGAGVRSVPSCYRAGMTRH